MKCFAYAAIIAAAGLSLASTASAAVIYTSGDGDYNLSFTADPTDDAVSFGMWNPPSFTYISNISLSDTTTAGPNVLTQAWENQGGPSYCCSGSGDDGSQAGYLESGSFAPYTVFTQDVSLNTGDTYDLSFTVSSSDGFTQYGAVGSVPEPATWMVLLAGFALTGAAVRGRRRGIATA